MLLVTEDRPRDEHVAHRNAQTGHPDDASHPP